MTVIPKFAVVVWVDVQTTLGWHADPSEIEPGTIITAGFVIGEDEHYLKLAPTVTLNCFADGTVILKNNVVFRSNVRLDKLEKWMTNGKK
jgi:hypothetical protein